MTGKDCQAALLAMDDKPTEDEVDAHIAWMRENVRCKTCDWLAPDPGGCGYCANEQSPCHTDHMLGDESCATHWEPKGGTP